MLEYRDMKKFILFAAAALLLFTGCKEQRSFTTVPCGEVWLSHIGFEDGSSMDFTVVTDVLYAGTDTSSRYKMMFYLPDGWDNSYPLFLDRFVPVESEFSQPWQAYQGAPLAEAALHEGSMIVVLVAYDEWTAIPDILLAEDFLKKNDADLPGDSKNILTAAYFDFE